MGDAGPASASVARPTSVVCTFTDHQPAEARSVTLKLPATVQWSEVNAQVQVSVLHETAVVRFAPVAASGGVGCVGGVDGGGGGFVALVVWWVVVVVPRLPLLLPRVQAPAAVLLFQQLLLLSAQLLLLASQVGLFAHAPASPLCHRNQRDKPPPLSPPGARTQIKSSPTSITATTFSLTPPSLTPIHPPPRPLQALVKYRPFFLQTPDRRPFTAFEGVRQAPTELLCFDSQSGAVRVCRPPPPLPPPPTITTTAAATTAATLPTPLNITFPSGRTACACVHSFSSPIRCFVWHRHVGGVVVGRTLARRLSAPCGVRLPTPCSLTCRLHCVVCAARHPTPRPQETSAKEIDFTPNPATLTEAGKNEYFDSRFGSAVCESPLTNPPTHQPTNPPTHPPTHYLQMHLIIQATCVRGSCKRT
jgi:hypothetical protein